MHDEAVVEQIRTRPGPDSFLDKLSQGSGFRSLFFNFSLYNHFFKTTQIVSKSVSYQSAAGNACPTGQSGEELQIYHAFTLIYRKHEAAIGRHVAQFEDIR